MNMKKYFDILKKYNLNKKINDRYEEKADHGAHNDTLMAKCTIHFLNEIWKTKKNELQQKIKAPCLIENNDRDCLHYFQTENCKNCKFYLENLKEIIEAQDELIEAMEAFETQSKIAYYNR
ncbi:MULTISPECIES: hypothetical protein [Psychrilyobacter]|uniref:Uncharacterized protein n=1 Tax=Psychrilyobacter piezotolerans TaxID=2293438 RepID=A0ABX9KDQ5_9FUSO|nr:MULTISPECIES: hypothetical protein [Psychrilyobacter]NDI79032.1 hypothetical protein [Psychrilyobacter piezotolerans]RDE59113.1 hypothetical protein DV867_13890 [Psychrilyobacter sp. S5]REI39684.1 hypothetical protein DYH56_13890 [Psychrilyobacter piezotolerans]